MPEYYGCRFCGYVTAIDIYKNKKIVEISCSDCGLPLSAVSAEVFEEYASNKENIVKAYTITDTHGKEIGNATDIITIRL